MKERPALFNTPMVQAILADLKDITRRTKGLELINTSPNSVKFIGELHPNYKQKPQPVFRFKTLPDSLASEYIDIQCPYGQPGDILWVRESFHRDMDGVITYKADHPHIQGIWKPSIHMPRAACRLKLKIVSIRPERLHDITEEDAIREGVDPVGFDHKTQRVTRYRGYPKDEGYFLSAKESFKQLWIAINGRESWDANLWVWRIEFEKI